MTPDSDPDVKRVARAFRSNGQALAFAAGVLLLLALPALFKALGLYSRRAAYNEAPVTTGGFAYVAHEVFEDKSDLDMLVVGPSTVWNGIDPRVLEEELSRAKGAPAHVRTFGHNWPGVDLEYAMLRDILARRRVLTVAIALPREREAQVEPHAVAHNFLPFQEDPALTAGFPLRERVTLYGEAVLGAPRHVVSLLRPDPPLNPVVAPSEGARLVRQSGYAPTSKAPPTLSAESMIYTPGAPSATAWKFEKKPLSPYQEHYVNLIADLLREHQVRLIAFHVPWCSKDRHQGYAEERFDWPKRLHLDGALVGVAPRALYQGLSDAEVKSLCHDQWHMNEAGARYFTKAIAPAFLEVHLRGR